MKLDKTPETDAEAILGCDYVCHNSCQEIVDAEFARELELRINDLTAEVARLKEGNLTSEEFHNLCHNKEKCVTLTEFKQGCLEYQKKLFGHHN